MFILSGEAREERGCDEACQLVEDFATWYGHHIRKRMTVGSFYCVLIPAYAVYLKIVGIPGYKQA